jgi:two-component sensor histidine kinase
MDSVKKDIVRAEPRPDEGRPDLSRGLLRATSNTATSVLYQTPEMVVLWSINVPEPWHASPFGTDLDTHILAEDGATVLAETRLQVLQAGHARSLELKIPATSGTRWFDVWVDADRDAAGQVIGLITTAVETTEHKRREQTLRALLREVSHRSKNLLAIILSIATQTGRYSTSIDTFLTRFQGRIQSLASSQDLVTSSDWRGADLRQLAYGQVARYCDDAQRSLKLNGASPYLNPNAALYIGLALHELAVNSVSFGALARPDGKVELLIETPETLGKKGVDMVWREPRVPSPQSLDQKRFGSVALERVVPTALDGTAKLTIEKDRVEYRLFIPAGNYEMAATA